MPDTQQLNKAERERILQRGIHHLSSETAEVSAILNNFRYNSSNYSEEEICEKLESVNVAIELLRFEAYKLFEDNREAREEENTKYRTCKYCHVVFENANSLDSQRMCQECAAKVAQIEATDGIAILEG